MEPERRSSLLCLALLAGPALAEPIRIVALGDLPYGDPAEVYAPYKTLIGAINAREPALVVHIGDTKSGGTPCSDALLDDQRGFLNSFAARVLYTPGDNEWTDCYRKAAGEFDPLERLAYIRRTYFTDPPKTMGAKPVAVDSQAAAGYPENSRLRIGDVAFVTAHVVGSNNNFEIRDPAAVAEFFARDAADIAWLNESFAANNDAAAIVVAIQADMFEFDFNETGDETGLRHSGFLNFGPALQKAATEFGKPVLLIFGDSHHFQVMRPFSQTTPNVIALEVFGEKDMDAVEIDIDGALSSPFSFRPLLNPTRPAAG